MNAVLDTAARDVNQNRNDSSCGEWKMSPDVAAAGQTDDQVDNCLGPWHRYPK